jgi:hypothetical protein
MELGLLLYLSIIREGMALVMVLVLGNLPLGALVYGIRASIGVFDTQIKIFHKNQVLCELIKLLLCNPQQCSCRADERF